MAVSDILVEGAREHNLRDIRLLLPRNQLICFTGVSGSGKSSLAFDTLYAEGQRRYVESLSTFARQFLGQMPKPDVDRITGLSPSISISQKTAGQSPRSTVGTITEIHDFLRVLFARVGKGRCPQCHRPITAQTREQILDRIVLLPAGTQFYILAPVIRGQKGEYKDLFDDLQKQGFVRARVDGRIIRLSDSLQLDRRMRHNIEVVVDRLTAGPKLRSRLAEAVELALRIGEGNLIVAFEPSEEETRGGEGGRGTRGEGRKPEAESLEVQEEAREKPAPSLKKSSSRRKKSTAVENDEAGNENPIPNPQSLIPSSPPLQDIPLSAHYACTHCQISFEPPSPQLFSFNSPQGMCPECSGLGEIYSFDPDKLIPDPSRSFQQGCFELLGKWKEMGRWAAAHLSRRRRDARTEIRTPRRFDPRNGVGENCLKKCGTPCSGAPATNMSPSPWRSGAVRLQMGRKIRRDHPQTPFAVPHDQEPAATSPTRKVHADHRLQKMRRRADLNPQARSVTLTTRLAAIQRSARTNPCRKSAICRSPTPKRFFTELELDDNASAYRGGSAQGNPRPSSAF